MIPTLDALLSQKAEEAIENIGTFSQAAGMRISISDAARLEYQVKNELLVKFRQVVNEIHGEDLKETEQEIRETCAQVVQRMAPYTGGAIAEAIRRGEK